MTTLHRAALGLILGLSATIGLAGCVSTTGGQPKAFTFAATGDGPYAEGDWTLLPQYFAAEKADGRARYLLHAGDLLKGAQVYDDAYSQRVAALYRQSSIPVIFVPGDNEWNDEPDPDAAWVLWTRDFLHFSEQFPGAPKLSRQPDRPENIAWLDEGVLFIGLKLVGGRMHDAEEWAQRHRANAEWVEQNLNTLGKKAYAVVVLGQATPKEMHEDFFRHFVPAVQAYGKPVMYLHGDGHNWQYEEGWRAPNLLRIQVDQVTKARPVHITVSPESPQHPFSVDRLGAESVTPQGQG